MARTVLVTGANSGIGLETALRCARLGFEVAGTVRSSEKAGELREAALSAGVDVEPVILDLTDDDACVDAVRHRDVWGLVNNAGFANVGAVEDIPPDEALAQLDVMVVAPMRLARLVLPGMRRCGEGRIVNVTSVLAHEATPLLGWYEASKRALATLTATLREEVARFGIEVVAVEPGGFRTRIWDRIDSDLGERGAAGPYRVAYERLRAMERGTRSFLGNPADAATVIAGALTVGRPRAHYPVGGDALLYEVVRRFVPGRTRERAMRAVVGL